MSETVENNLEMDPNQLAARLERLSEELQTLARGLLRQGEPKLPETAQHQSESGICLNCSKPLAGRKSRVVRGLHESCYKEVMKEIDSGSYSEAEAIEEGLILPGATGGRPAKDTKAKQLAARKRAAARENAEAQADVDELEAKVLKKKPTEMGSK